MSNEEIYYKYQAIYAYDNNFALCNLTNNILYFTDPVNFNDPFDCKIYVDNKGTKEQWIEWFKKKGYADRIADVDKFIKHEDGLISPKDNYYPVKVPPICCFSKYDNIILMWSHYANHHKGIVLGFRATQSSAMASNKKEYSIPLYIPGTTVPLPCKFNRVDYNENDIPLIKQFGDERYNLKVACKQLVTKSCDWQYEKEYRIIPTENNSPEHIPNSNSRDRMYKYNREDLKKIIFGCKVTKDIAQRVYDIINKNNLDKDGNEITEYYEAKDSQVKCEINVKLIPDIDAFINTRPENRT